MSQLKSGVLTVIPYQLDLFIVKVGQADNVMDNDLVMGKGFWKPHGYTGKGTTGKGQGTYLETLGKPLPSSGVRGYPWYMPWVFHLYKFIFIIITII